MDSSLDELVKTSEDEDFEITRKIFGDRWEFLREKMFYPYELFKKIIDYIKPLRSLKEEH